MNGDRLKELEEGFLEGKLSPEQETELKDMVSKTDDHHLKAYFQWASGTEGLEMPDMSSKLNLEEAPKPFWQLHFRKLAAAILMIIAATFIFYQQPSADSNKTVYTQAEIDESYEATIETLTAMATFLDKSINSTEKGIDFSTPFKELKTLNNTETQKP